MSRVGGLSAKSISQLLSNYIGETVTIFTKAADSRSRFYRSDSFCQ